MRKKAVSRSPARFTYSPFYIIVLPFSNPPRNETKTRSSKELPNTQIPDGAFLTPSVTSCSHHPLIAQEVLQPHGVVVMVGEVLRGGVTGGDTNGTWSTKKEAGRERSRCM